MSLKPSVAGHGDRASLRLRRENKRLSYELKVFSQQIPHLRQMIEFCPDGLALLSSDGRIIEHNAAMVGLFGDGSALAGQGFAEVVRSLLTRPESIELFAPAALAKSLSSPYTLLVPMHDQLVEFRFSGWVAEDGARYLVSARPVGSEDQKERALLAARQQIQDLDAQLREQQRQAEVSRLDSLAVLASTMVHDLNNALAVVHANVEMLRDELGPGDHTELLDDACSGTSRVQELVSRLRSFSMGPSLVLRQLCLTDWISDFLRPIAAGQHTQLVLDIAREHCWVSVDENQLSQVLLNLVTNATQAAHGIGVEPMLQVALRPAAHGFLTGSVVRPVAEVGGPHLLLTVEDNGPGIPRDGFGRLFTPFHTTKRNGSGLGLASVARIIQLHRGGVAVENRPEGGARFTIALPLVSSCTSVDLSEGPTQAVVPSEHLEGVQVIVMDDEPMVRTGIRRLLVAGGAQVHEVARGEALLAAYELARSEGQHPVCIVDIHIKAGMGGFAVMRELRARWPSVRAIACTGHAEVQSTDQFRTLGFDDWLVKPFEARRLRRAVHRLAFPEEHGAS